MKPCLSTRRVIILAGIITGTNMIGLSAGATGENPRGELSLTSVQHVDLARYTGTWYEIAKIPNRFQKQCGSNTTATYILRPDGRLDVVNRCRKKDGEMVEARGLAKVVDLQTNAKLKVSFVSFLGVRPFWGDYWILGLDENYQWVIVGSPGRKYGWILSRTPKLEPVVLERIYALLREQEYDPDDFEMSPQN
jgi:apolipoprotein D and lipocalin family protein